MMNSRTRIDTALALSLAVAMASATIATGRLSPMEAAGVTVVASGLLALAFRRARPLMATTSVAVVAVVDCIAAPAGTMTPAFIALMLSSYSLAVHASLRGLATGVATLIGAIAVVQTYTPSDGHSRLSALTFFGCVLVLAPAAIGAIVRMRSALVERLRVNVEAQRSQEPVELANHRAAQLGNVNAAVERVVLIGLDEMRPFAAIRDLPDVVAVRDLGRGVLGQMRELLNDLRTSSDAVESRAPSHKISELRTQVERVLDGRDRDLKAARRALRTVLTQVRIEQVLAVFGGTYALLIVAANLSGPTEVSHRVVACVAGAAASLSVACAVRRPVPAATVAMASVVVYTITARPPDPVQGLVAGLCFIAFPLVTGAARQLSVAVAGLAICLASAVGIGWGRWSELASSSVLAFGAWAAGRLLRTGAHALEADARAAAHENDMRRARLDRALRDDRALVARDVHDAVGHAMTGIVLQATAAARVWETNEDMANQHVSALRRSLAETLDELRPLMTAIALDDGMPALETGLADLAERARNCGLNVNAPERRAVDLTTYRIVQEALTNAARYAPGATVTIHIDDVSVEVVNTPPPYPVLDHAGSGHGLRGMAERAAAVGGSVEAGPTDDGGFRVRAVLPRIGVLA